MRLQLIASALGPALAMLAVHAAPARAQTEFVSKLQVYADSDHTTVVSPLINAQADVGKDTNVSAGYVADVISSASIDIVSQASPTTIHDVRHQVSTALTHKFGSLTANAAYIYSTENDYSSHVVSMGVSKDLAEKDTTLALGYSLAMNDVGRHGDINFHESLTVNELTLAWTQMINPRTATQLSYGLGIASGYQASAYRFVPVMSGGNPMYWVPETDPDSRVRHALVFGVNRYLFQHSALQADYRYYRDTWGISSHTVRATYISDLSKRTQLRVRNRLYSQNGATFYKSEYDALQKYMALDRELSPLWSETIGAKLTRKFAGYAEAELKADLFYYSYSDFPLLPSRTGVNIGVGVGMTY